MTCTCYIFHFTYTLTLHLFYSSLSIDIVMLPYTFQYVILYATLLSPNSSSNPCKTSVIRLDWMHYHMLAKRFVRAIYPWDCHVLTETEKSG